MTHAAAPPRTVPYAVYQREQERRIQAEQFILWESQIFAHPALDAGDKLFLRTQKLVEMRQRPQTVEGQTVWRVDNEELSKGMGNHSSTVTNKYAKLEASGLISRVPIPYTLPSGESVTLMFGKLADVVDEPPKIEVSRIWGGKRTKKCLKEIATGVTCGGDLQIERHALVTQERSICTKCGEETVYAPAIEHPGFHAEIITDAQEETITIRRKRDPEEAPQQQKQDAFTDELNENTMLDCESPQEKPDVSAKASGEKQDAFGPVLPGAPLQLASPSPIDLVKQVAIVNPITPPHVLQHLSTWLEKRVGDGRIIKATGKSEHAKKYFYEEPGYMPDLAASIAGDREHIYGSRPLRADGTTYLLAFDNDTQTRELLYSGYMTDLARAGISSLCWLRQGGRWHLEIYFDVPVDACAAYAWCLAVCPELAEIAECYPVKTAHEDKRHNALSWPLYQRIGRQVIPCAVAGMLAELPGEVITHAGIRDTKDLRRLVDLIGLAVTPAALIPPYTLPPDPDPKPAAPAASKRGGWLLENPPGPRPHGPATGEDVRAIVLAESNAALTWEEVADLCGGLDAQGRFKAVWRGERTASVKVDRDGRYACDYGNHGSYPRKLDKFGAWCLAKGIDMKAEITRRCAEYRERHGVRPGPPREITFL